MQKRILVLGATGTLGQPVSHCLKEAGFQIRVMTRNLQKARKTFDSPFDVIAGDPMDTGCLEKALEGCFGVHISLPSEIEQQAAESVVRIAQWLGVERITYISGATVAEENRWFPMINRKFMAERVIHEAGVPNSIFCPTWVMESLPMFVNQGRASVLGKQPHPYHWVAAEDIARTVATAYELGDKANGRFVLLGPEVLRMEEALRRYCAVFHPDIKEVSSMPFWLVRLLASLMGNRELKGAGELMAYFEKVGEGRNLPNVNGVFDTPSTNLDMWLQKRKAKAG